MSKILTLFDLDHTLLPIDSDYEWGQFLVRVGAVDPIEYSRRNADFYAQYEEGILDPVEYLEFALGALAQFPRQQLNAWHEQFMREVILPSIRPVARHLLSRHEKDLIAIVTATHLFITQPIAKAFGVEHILASVPEETAQGEFTGKCLGVPNFAKGKVIHVENWLARLGKSWDSFEKSYFYSDSQNDLPLLERVTHPIATNPNTRLKAVADSRGWPVLNLFDNEKTD